MEDYKKTYKGFIIWLIFYCVITTVVCFIPIEDVAIMLRIILNITTIGLALLTFIIYKTEYIYWYNGTSYEEALDAGSERRREFAMAHFKRFSYFAGVFLIYSLLAQFLELNDWIDVGILLIGIVGVAISTVSIKL